MVIQYLPKYSNIEEQKNEVPLVMTHVLIKGIQGGQVIASAAFLGLRLFKKKPSLTVCLKNGTLFGSLFGLGAGGYTCYSSPEKNQGRAFRLQRSYFQNYYEDWTVAGMLVGGGLFYLVPGLYMTSGLVYGSTLGLYTSMGVVLGQRYGLLSDGVVNKFEIEDKIDKIIKRN